jgi:GAF domain-containing protein/anti-sigma regulatory factor (Ser/Thr protein kinase)
VESGDPAGDDASYTRLRQLQTISEAALAHLRFDELLEELLRRVSGILSADTAAVLMLDEERGELIARAARGLEEEVRAGVRIPLGRGFAGRIAHERRPIAIADVEHADVLNPILREKGLSSLLGAPLVVEGRVIGVLHVGTLKRRDFTPDDTELLQLAADRMAVAIDHSRLYESERSAAEQLRRLEAVTEAALSHLTTDELLDVLLARLRVMLSTDTAAVMLVRDGLLETRAALGLGDWVERGMAVKLGEGFVGRVAAERRPLVVVDAREEEELGGFVMRSGVRSLVGVPLIVAGEVIGALTLGTWELRRFEGEDVDLLVRAADRIAVAIENARLYEAERDARAAAERARERLSRMESISQVAFNHLSIEPIVLERLLAQVGAVLYTDTAAVFELDDERQTLVARASNGPEEVERGVRVPVGRGFAGLVAERGAPVRSSELEGELELVSPMLREHGIVSLLGVPLLVEDQLLGVLHVGSREPREFTDDDVALLELAASRLAVALAHSRLYEREHRVAATLQRSLLPEHLPEVEGATLASRYLPGATDAAVGGDWFDVIPLAGGRVGLAMGDVVSRGVRAASVMGQLRNALRAYALDGRPPAAVLDRLHALLRTLERREMATLAYMVLDPRALSYTLASAGHPPPLVLAEGGAVDLIEEGRGPPLGAVSEALYTEASGVIAPGSTLLLYTDGLVERRDMWLDEGLERLCVEAGAAAGAEPEELLDRLLGTLVPEGGGSDDVAALAVRLTPLARERLVLRLPAEPPVLASLRRTLRQWLEAQGAGEMEVYDVLVAVTEAAANAVEHAYGPVDATFDVEVRASEDGEICVLVRDQGRWRPPRGHNRGRGTLLMQELMDHFEVTTSDSGTEVRMRRRLERHGAPV